jgi:3' terminal RNA ribose 2'-O-methyltransferase Hen1
MILISTTHKPATDLGYLLHKNPGRVHSVDVSFGKAYVVFPDADENICTAALLLDVDTVGLVRGKRGDRGSLREYVNDRAYCANSYATVALRSAFATALNGRCKERPELAKQEIPLEIRIPVLPCAAGPARIRALFEPLGYEVTLATIPLDPEYPEWGDSPYVDLTLRGNFVLHDALRHLYILLPSLDVRKHYYLDSQEVQKMVTKGEGWLETHPERGWITRTYLGGNRTLVQEALEQLSNSELTLDAEAREVESQTEEEDVVTKSKPKLSLHQMRHARVCEIVRVLKPKSLVDLGCGDGKLLRELIKVPGLDRIVGMDVSYFALERAQRRLRLEEAGPRMKERVQLIHGSLMYRDKRLEGFDVCTIVEVIEHLDLPRLATFERVVFEYARPKVVILTTPNRDYNPVYELEGMRHDDHRFEWSTEEFRKWCEAIQERFGYTFAIEGVGEAHDSYGCSSNLAVFTQ